MRYETQAARTQLSSTQLNSTIKTNDQNKYFIMSTKTNVKIKN